MLFIFDLDDTLYVSKELKAKRKEAMLHKIMARKNCSYEEASVVSEELKKQGLSWQQVFFYLGLRKEDFWESFNDVQHAVPFDGQVYQCLKKLAQMHTLVLLTNSPRKAASNVLQDLMIMELFSRIYVAEDVAEPKPSLRPFQQILADFTFAPDECLALGSSPKKDLEPAAALGMKTMFLSPSTILELRKLGGN